MQELKQCFFNAGVIPSTHKNNYIVPCPIHGESSGKSLSISFDIGKWQCFGKCNTGGKISKLLNLLGIGVYMGLTFSKGLSNPLEVYKYNNEIEDWSDYRLDKFNQYHQKNNIDYFYKRGLSDEIIKVNKLSYNDWNKRVYMPVFCNKTCYGYVSRTTLNTAEILDKISLNEGIPETYRNELSKQLIFIQDLSEDEVREISIEDNPLIQYYQNLHKYKPFTRYTNSFNLPKDDLVYEPLSNDDTIPYYIVTEGIVDALLGNAYGINSFAVLGTGINESQVRYIIKKSKGKLILMFDNDSAGRGFIKDFSRLAKEFYYIPNWNILGRSVKDIGDLKGKEEFDKLIESIYLSI